MRIVQTFWSGGKNPLEDSFGWLNAESHLLSWALSCLCLKKYYEEVVLYTDSIGYDIFVNKLKLPYSDVIVCYDDLKCTESLWAYPKLLTYSAQTKPFIHIDGDVYVCKKFRPEIQFADLIAQNEEIGTPYYKNMMNAIQMGPIKLPEVLEKELKKESISSYNAGIIGGNDLKFIKEYCDTAFEFIRSNGFDTKNGMFINHNILFEQILFHAASSKYPDKKVSTVHNFKLNDNGYTYEQFCDFYLFENGHKFMHIIGGHKKNEKVCNLLGRTLLKHYPDYFFRIINLFAQNHRRFVSQESVKFLADNQLKKEDDATLGNDAEKFNSFLKNLTVKWDKISNDELIGLEKLSGNYFEFLNMPYEDKLNIVLERNPYLELYESSGDFAEPEKDGSKKTNKVFHPEKTDYACFPELLNQGYKYVRIDDIAYNVLVILHQKRTFGELMEIIRGSFKNLDESENHKNMMRGIIYTLEYLFYHKLIYILND